MSDSARGQPSGGVERLTAELHGRVQGVGYRYFVQDKASRLGITGWVRNLSDGRTVELIAEGPRDRLERLLDTVRRGPPGSYVERASADWSPATGEFRGFSVRH